MRFLLSLIVFVQAQVVCASGMGGAIDASSGFILSVASAKSDTDEGLVIELNAIAAFVNASVEYIQLEKSSIGNVFSGVGIVDVLQFKVGLGTEGPLYKLQSDLILYRDGLSITSQSLSLKIASEWYRDKKELNNIHVGLGWMF